MACDKQFDRKAHLLNAEQGYTEDKTVPKDSVTPTFACAVLRVNNPRWKGVPFILKCGKALDERKASARAFARRLSSMRMQAEIRVQFRRPLNDLFADVSPNELVLRVQPDEAVYLKMTTKRPGLHGGSMHTELNLSYRERCADCNALLLMQLVIDTHRRFKEEAKNLPDAYERLILDVVRGDHNLFVRSDEVLRRCVCAGNADRVRCARSVSL